MAEADFDVLILGAGSGGYACALRAAQLGLSVGLVEKGNLGGTCLHVGCIPTKALLHAAEVADSARDSEQFGVRATLDGIDMAGVNAYKDGVVARLFKGLTGLIKGRGITVIEGEGRLTGPREVTVDGTAVRRQARRARLRLLLQVAARPRRRRRAGDHLRARAAPRPGAGVGGRAGRRRDRRASSPASGGRSAPRSPSSRRCPGWSPAEDEASSKALERAFRKRGIAMRTGTPFQSVKTTDDGVAVTVEGGDVIEAELLLVAVGRGPSTDGLGYDEQGVAMERGFVLTDERCRTNLEGVYAVGDIVPGLQLAHRGLPAGHLRRRGHRRARRRRPSTRPASRASPTPTPRSPPSA